MATELRLDFVCPKTKDDFISSSEGLFCTECQKPVLDFTGKMQHEIVRELRKYPETPCVLIPADALRQPATVNRPRWKTVPKSAALLGLLLVLGEVKTLFSQTARAVKNNDPKPTTPQGHQVVLFTGRITDTDGKGLKDAELVFTFLSETVGRGRTDENGAYSIYVENYGGIREVDISVELNGYDARKFTDVSVTKPNPTFFTELTKTPEQTHRQLTMMVGGIGYYISPSFYTLGLFSAWYEPQPAVDIFGHPPVRFDAEPLEYLEKKLSYRALITDRQGNAIPGARVQMRFEGNATREGFSDANGLAVMNMQLDTPALNAHIIISAPGYYNKTIPYYEFNDENPVEHKLMRRPVEKPEEPEETHSEPVLPVPPTVNRQTESETEAARSLSIWVYPNPANETVTIRLPGTDKTSSIQINEEYGRVVAHKSSYGEGSVTLDTQRFVPGTYVVQVTYNGAIYREKLLIVR